MFWMLPPPPVLPVLPVLPALLVNGFGHAYHFLPPPQGGGFYLGAAYPGVRFSGPRAYTVIEVMKVTSCEWVAAVNALALAIAKDRQPDEIEFLALLLTQLGDTLMVLATSPPKCF